MTDSVVHPGRPPRQRWALHPANLPPAWRVGLSAWLGSRVALLVLALIVGQVWPAPRHGRWPGWLWPFTVYDRWDSGWFLHVARFGYFVHGPRDQAVAFFPGYPLAGRLLAEVLDGPRPAPWAFLVSLSVLAWAAALVAVVQLWSLVAEQVSTRAATAAVVLLLFGPFAYVLMASYSESLYLALALAAWRCARREAYGWAGLLAGLATLVRINGVFLGVALLVMAGITVARQGSARRDLPALLLPFVAVFGYFAYLRSRTGAWNAWSRAEAMAWNRHFALPWQAFERTWHLFEATRRSPAAHVGWALEILFVGGYVLMVAVLLARRCWPELTLVVLTAASLTTTTYFQSVPRSTLTVIPVYVLVGGWAAHSRHRWAVAAAGAAVVALGVFQTTIFLHGTNGL